MDVYDLDVDFMDMTNDGRLWTRVEDARPGFVPVAGRHVIVGCEEANPAVAHILSVNAEGRHRVGGAAGQRRLAPVPARSDLTGRRFDDGRRQ